MKKQLTKHGILQFEGNISRRFRRWDEVRDLYIKNGICYSGSIQEDIRVTEAKPLRGGIILVTFSTGEKRLFDTTRLTGPAFAPLADEEVFSHPAIFHGVITWKNGEIDIAPETVYQESYAYSEAI